MNTHKNMNTESVLEDAKADWKADAKADKSVEVKAQRQRLHS